MAYVDGFLLPVPRKNLAACAGGEPGGQEC